MSDHSLLLIVGMVAFSSAARIDDGDDTLEVIGSICSMVAAIVFFVAFVVAVLP